MLPGFNGFEVCRRLRQFTDAYALMLTARDEEIERIGLEVGADDYLTKPFSPRELVARVKAVLRRPRVAGLGIAESPRMGPLAIDQARHEVALDGQPVALTPRELLLVATAAAVGMAVLASLFVTRRIVGPLQRLVAASQRIADGHCAERVPVMSRDQLDVPRSFDAMASALETTERRRRELLGDVPMSCAPIATLEGYLEDLLDVVVEAGPPTCARLHGEAGRLRRLVEDLEELSRAEVRQIRLVVRPTEPVNDR